MKKIFYSTISGVSLLYYSRSFASFGVEKVDPYLKSTTEDADLGFEIQYLVANLMYFLYLLAVLVIIYAGFNMLTAGGDEEKVKKAKNLIIYAVIGLIVIFLASSIINWLVNEILI